MKNKYYRIQFKPDESVWFLAAPPEGAPLDVRACKRVDSQRKQRFIVYSDGRRVDFNEASHCIIVVSPRLADEFVRSAGQDIQLLPAEISGDDSSWWVINVLSRVDCIDRQRSIITYYPANHLEYPGEPRGVVKLILDPARIGNHEILRPKGWEVVAVVSENLKRAIETLGATGAQFSPVTGD